MQCYQTLASVVAVANAIDSIPGVPHKMPYNLIYEWMDENDIDANEILWLSPEQVREIVKDAIHRDLPLMSRAA